MKLCIGDKEYFKGIREVVYEGERSDNPLAFKYYNAEKKVGGKSMQDHFRFAVAYWHSFKNTGADPFGMPTKKLPWLDNKDVIGRAKDTMDAAFEFITKMGIPFYCFHDYDLVDEGNTWKESEKRIFTIVEYAKEKQRASGVKPLWGTANLFTHPRYMNGAATNPEFETVCCAAAQVKTAIDATQALGGAGFVFWGGREGYLSLLNTDMKRERQHLATFLHMAKDYGRKSGFKGQFLIEPKPMEPSKHQYDFDVAAVIGFLREFDLVDEFKLNIEVNHATLAGHSFQHELQAAADQGLLGSIDANRGDYQNGWDTDQFPNNVAELTEAMLVILGSDSFKKGGVNFDAKTRRNSTDLADLFYAHIGGMDAFARALVAAHDILTKGKYNALKKQRYTSFDKGHGKKFESGKLTLTQLHQFAHKNKRTAPKSGRQELWENLVQR